MTISFTAPKPEKIRIKLLQLDGRTKRITYKPDPNGIELTVQGALVVQGPATDTTQEPPDRDQLTPAEWISAFNCREQEKEKEFADFKAAMGEPMPMGLYSDCHLLCTPDGALDAVNRRGQHAAGRLVGLYPSQEHGVTAGASGSATIFVYEMRNGPFIAMVGDFEPMEERAWFFGGRR